MNPIETIEINNEKIYLRKGFAGWKVIHPWKIDGKINWKNFLLGGSWWNFFVVTIIVIMILLCVSEYSKAVEFANNCIKDLNAFKGFSLT